METIGDLLSRDLTRRIEEVIQVHQADEQSVYAEVSEYVATNSIRDQYAMLLKDCFSALCIVGFDPYRGFFHTGRHGKPSLALDLMEEFRAVIADSVVLTLVNNRMLTP